MIKNTLPPIRLCRTDLGREMCWCPTNKRLVVLRIGWNSEYNAERVTDSYYSINEKYAFIFWRRASTKLGHRIQGLESIRADNSEKYRKQQEPYYIGDHLAWNGIYSLGCCDFTKPQLEKLWRALADIFGYYVDEDAV